MTTPTRPTRDDQHETERIIPREVKLAGLDSAQRALDEADKESKA